MSIAQLKKTRPQIFTFDEANGTSIVIVGKKGKTVRLLITEEDPTWEPNLIVEVTSKTQGVVVLT